MLAAKSALNYVDFMKKYFGKDILAKDGLFILPLGFKLPFKPEDFLTKQAAHYILSPESKEFVESIVKVITELDSKGISVYKFIKSYDKGIEDTIVIGFDIYLENVKRMKNSDLLVAITSQDDADMSFAKVNKIQVTNDPNAQKVRLSDDEFIKQYPLSYGDVCSRCRDKIEGFKQNQRFNSIMEEIKKEARFAFTRKLNPNNLKSSRTTFYAESVIDEIVSQYIQRNN